MKNQLKTQKISDLKLLLPILPAVLFISIFVIIPAGWAVFVSFTNQSLLGSQSTQFEFIGLDNYRRLFQDDSFWNSLHITLGFVLTSAVVGQSLLGLFLAILLKPAKLFGKGIIGSSIIFAWIIPEIVTVYIWASVLNFLLNILKLDFNQEEGEHIFVKSNLKKRKVYIKDIKWIEALGDYVKLVTEETSLVVLSTMKSFEKELPENKFLRIHKSYIVNLDKIDRFNSKNVEVGAYEIPLSRNKKTQLVDALNNI